MTNKINSSSSQRDNVAKEFNSYIQKNLKAGTQIHNRLKKATITQKDSSHALENWFIDTLANWLCAVKCLLTSPTNYNLSDKESTVCYRSINVIVINI